MLRIMVSIRFPAEAFLYLYLIEISIFDMINPVRHARTAHAAPPRV